MDSRLQRATDSRLGRRFAWVSLGRVAAAFLQAVLLLLAARSMDVGSFGYLAAFLGVTTIGQVAIDLGLSTMVIRERAADPASGAVAAALQMVVVTSVALVFLLILGLAAAGFLVSSIYWSMLPLAIWAAGERNADSFLAVTFADGDVHVNTVNVIARRLAAILLFMGGMSFGAPAVLCFSVACALSAIASAVFAAMTIRRLRLTPANSSKRNVLRTARPFWIHAMATQARNFDTVIVATFGGATQAGLYSSGSRLVSPLRILPTSLAALLLPDAARSDGKPERLMAVAKMTLFITMSMSFLYGGVFAVTPWLVESTLGSDYEKAVGVIQVILFGLPFAAAVSMLASILQGLNRSKTVAAASISSTVVCLVGIAVVSPVRGAVGAASALSASFIFQFLILLWATLHVYRSTRVVKEES